MNKIKISERMLMISIIIILAVVLLFSVKSCNSYKSDAIVANLKLNQDSIKFQTKLDKLGNSYIEQEQRIANYEDALNAGLINEQDLKAKNLKNVETIINLRQQVSGLNDTILKYKSKPAIITIIDTTTHDTVNYLKIPIEASFSNKWVIIKETILKEGIRIDTLSLVNDQKIYIALRKNGFLRKSTPVITIESSNPYFAPIKMDNIIIEHNIPWYQKNITWGIIGAIGGFILTR